jgi:hypothetical protein
MRTLLLVVVLLAVRSVGAQPIDSDRADGRADGGCYPTALTPSVLDMLVLINPEWAPIVNGKTIDSDPVLVSGTVEDVHGLTSGDFPSTHLFSDVVMDVRVDPEHEDKVATGNDEEHVIAFEWEVGAFPDWAWPGQEDRIYGLGRHIFDCGHPAARAGHCAATPARECVLDTDCRQPVCSTCSTTDTCEGEHFGYSSEIHPPHATAVIRQERGAVLSKKANAKPVPATIADVWVSGNGGGAGDRCVLEHHASEADQLAIECWPLSQRVAKVNATDFTFSVPLPPKPAHAGKPRVRLLPPPESTDAHEVDGGRPARLKVKKHLDDTPPSLEVTVRMTKKVKGGLPTGFEGRLIAGWNDRTATLTHVRVTASALLVSNDLERVTPLIPRTCSVSDTPCATSADCPATESCWGAGPIDGWAGQMAVDGEWRRYTGPDLDHVDDGSIIPLAITLEQYLPDDGELRIQADAFSRDCIDTAYGQPLKAGLDRLGLLKGIQCLGLGTSHPAGKVDVSYAGPDFGAGPAGTQTYETQSVGGEGGNCSLTTGLLCVVDDDCPSGETCTTAGGAFRLRYTIDKVS